jgi:tetratricopeptide (TPR) repeat protein
VLTPKCQLQKKIDSMKQLKILILFALLALVAVACKTKSGKPTKLGKFYHNVTGRYNAYYNADLLLMESFESLNRSHQDNYNKLIPLYPYAAVSDPNTANATLDEAIKKCAINIELHRPSDWVDDSYFLVGQSEFLKQEYEKAASTFKYIVDKYNPELLEAEEEKASEKKGKKKKKKKKKKKRKKKKKKKKKKPSPKAEDTEEEEEGDQKPKKYFLKHRPVRQEAMLWLAKTYVEMDQHDDAGTYLRLMQEDPTVRRKLKAEVYAVSADSWIKRKDYQKAIEDLEQALKLSRNKKKKTRYTYVLAQLYQELENDQLAMENFRKVLRLRPTYEMEFNARLNMATSAAGAQDRKFNPEMALNRMLRDPKNEEYKDQIYFALAQIAFKDGNRNNGIAALKQAMANSGPGSFQRAEASYMLAELYYKEEAYVEAYHYYDTASTSLQKEDERVDYVGYQKDQLKDLATNIEIVSEKDSLLTIASWEYEKQRELVQRLRKEEQEEKSNTKDPRKGPAPGGVRINSNEVNQSKFQLYNATMVKRGERDFRKRWGDRPYRDNWRRSNNNSFETNEGDVVKGNNALPPVTEQDVTEYLKKMGVPQDEAASKKMDEDIASALFKVGSLYYERLRKKDKAMEAFKELMRRYPDNKNELEVLYMMYNIAVEDKNTAEAKRYKDQILDKYGESDIAKAIQDPNFMNAKQKELQEINQYYEDTYSLIQNGKSEEAFKRIQDLPSKYGNDYPMKARFALLAAMCQGGMKGVDEYVRALRTVATSFPDTEEEAKAKEMIALLTGNGGGKPKPNRGNKPNDKPNNSIFVDNMKEGHYIIVAFDEAKAKVNDYKGPIVDYNKQYFSLKRLNVSSLMLDGKFPSLIIRKFKNGTEAQEYYNTVSGNKEFLGESAEAHQVYFIGQSNYRQILQKRNFAAYKDFFNTTYRED